jgi:hypothetical protein
MISALKLSAGLSSKKPFSYSSYSWLFRPDPEFWGHNLAADMQGIYRNLN